MKKTLIYSSFFLLHFFDVKAQCNLVPNPSFEIIINCLSGLTGLQQGYAPPWDSPTNGSPDLFNSCIQDMRYNVPFNLFGFQQSHSGNGYSMISSLFPAFNGQREYIQVELDSTLSTNTTYCISFFVNLSDTTGLGTNNIGMYFSSTHTFVGGFQCLNFIPQINFTSVISDTANWTEISGTYTAQGGERYIIIGNFYPDNLTDTVSIQTSRPPGLHLADYYIDDVDVHKCTCNVGVQELEQDFYFKLSPNPNNGTMQLNYSLDNNETGLLKLFDIVGKEISEYRLVQGNTTLNINEEKLNNGLYIYKVIVNDKVVKSDRLVIVK